MTVWRSEDGLPQNSVNAIIQTQDGYMWLGTQDGLVRFDGMRFKTYNTENSPKLENNYIWTLTVDTAGSIWMGTDGGGISRFDGVEFVTYGASDSLHPTVFGLSFDPDGTLWAATGDGLSYLTSDGFKRLNKRDGLSANTMLDVLADHHGNIWVTPSGGFIHKISSAGITTYPLELSAECIYEQQDGTILFGAGGKKLTTLIDDKLVEVIPKEKIPTSVRTILEDRQGNLWIGTKGAGLVRYDGSTYHHLYSRDGSYGNFVASSFEDREGNLWFGTWDDGVYQLSPSNFDNFSTKHGLRHDLVLSVLVDSKDRILAGTYGGGVTIFDDGQAVTYRKGNGLTNSSVTALLETNDKEIWIGTFGGGIDVLSDGQFQNLSTKDGLTTSAVTVLYQSSDNTVWAGVEQGRTTLNFRRPNTTAFSRTEETITSEIKVIAESSDSTLWIGTYGHGLLKTSLSPLRLVPETTLDANQILAIYPDEDNNLWVGTPDNGICLRRHGEWTSINTRHGLPTDIIHFIIEDHAQNLWVTSSIGVFRVAKNDLLNIHDGNATHLDAKLFDHRDGMISRETSSGRQPVAGKSSSGILYFATDRGVSFIDPRNVIFNKVAPPVRIEGITADGLYHQSDGRERLSFPSGTRSIELDYAALSFTSPERVQFEYKFGDQSGAWQSAGSRRNLSFYRLPHGAHNFAIRAFNEDGIPSSEIAEINFYIEPPWWQSGWAYVLYLLVLVGAALVTKRVYALRTQARKQAAALQQLETQRLRELDAFKSSFFANVSHEFRTPLTIIGGTLKKMRIQVQDNAFNSRIAMLLRNTSRLERLVNQLIDLSILDARKMSLRVSMVAAPHLIRTICSSFESHAEHKDIKFQVGIESADSANPTFVDTDKLEKILYNLLSNAFKYTESGGNVEVGATIHERIDIRITDTGCGIKPEELKTIFEPFRRAKENDISRTEGAGIGLSHTRQLVEVYRGEITLTSEYGRGTQVDVTLPISRSAFADSEVLAEETRVPYESEEIAETESTLDSTEQVKELQRTAKAKHSVLIVEDNADLRSYLKECLQPRYHFFEAINGKNGLELALKQLPDLILSDVMMPEMDGYELCQAVRKDNRISHIPIILLTAKGSGEHKIEGLERGADAYLIKPFDEAELIATINNLIKSRHDLQTRFRQDFINTTIEPELDLLVSMDQQFIDQARSYIEQNMGDDEFKIADLVTHLGLTHRQVNRKFTAITGKPVTGFVDMIRLKAAAQMLQNRTGTIAEIALDVGFSNPAHFSRKFRGQYGLSPSEYSKKSSR